MSSTHGVPQLPAANKGLRLHCDRFSFLQTEQATVPIDVCHLARRQMLPCRACPMHTGSPNILWQATDREHEKFDGYLSRCNCTCTARGVFPTLHQLLE